MEDGDIMRAYSNPDNPGYQRVWSAKLEHQYLTNCEIVLSVKVYYTILSLSFLALIIWWWLLTYRIHVEDSTTMQRGLMMLPIFKLICVFIYGTYVS